MSNFLTNLVMAPTSTPSSAPSVSSVERPKAKKATVLGWPMGTEIGKFNSWEFADGKLKYTDSHRDLKAFTAALYAGVEYGAGTVTTARGQGTGTFWSSSIGTLQCPPTNFPVNVAGDVIKVGTKFILPVVGSRVSEKSLVGYLNCATGITPANFCNPGCQGKLLGAASPIGPVCTNWTDFIYFYLLSQERKSNDVVFHVDKSCSVRYNTIRDVYTDITSVNIITDQVPDDGKKHIVFLSALDRTRLSRFMPGWVPFVNTACGSEYFCGVAGIYPIANARDGILADAHQKHFFNYMGLVAYLKLQRVEVNSPRSLKDAMAKKEAKQGVALIRNIGVIGLGLLPEGKDEDSVLGGGEVCEPSKTSWNYTCSSLHTSDPWTKRKPFVLADAETARGSKEEPILIKHKKVTVVSAFTTCMKWSDLKGKSGHAWNSTCLTCNRTWYVDPLKLLNESLREPVKLPPPAEEEEGELMPEGEFDAKPDIEEEPPAMDEDGEVEGGGGGEAGAQEEGEGEDPQEALKKLNAVRLNVVSEDDGCKVLTVFDKVPDGAESIGKIGLHFRNVAGEAHLIKIPDGVYMNAPEPPPVLTAELEIHFANVANLSMVKREKAVWWSEAFRGPAVIVRNGVGIRCVVVGADKVHAVLNVGGIILKVAVGKVINIVQMCIRGISSKA